MLNQDYKEMLSLFLENQVEFIIVGAYALAIHGFPRATGDIDLFIKPSEENSHKVFKCLSIFGAPINKIQPNDFSEPNVVFQIGIAPRRIDLITMLNGVSFDEAISDSKTVELESLKLPFISRINLIKNKESTGRPKDIIDVENLKQK